MFLHVVVPLTPEWVSPVRIMLWISEALESPVQVVKKQCGRVTPPALFCKSAWALGGSCYTMVWPAKKSTTKECAHTHTQYTHTIHTLIQLYFYNLPSSNNKVINEPHLNIKLMNTSMHQSLKSSNIKYICINIYTAFIYIAKWVLLLFVLQDFPTENFCTVELLTLVKGPVCRI